MYTKLSCIYGIRTVPYVYSIRGRMYETDWGKDKEASHHFRLLLTDRSLYGGIVGEKNKRRKSVF